jgi:hypothetical protein
MSTVLSAAFKPHQPGRYTDAARRYHGLLEREPN